MKYFLLILMSLTTACTEDKSVCEMIRGAKAFYGQNSAECDK